jgi:glycine/D-amino acid oxidase-like deaminating enzyme
VPTGALNMAIVNPLKNNSKYHFIIVGQGIAGSVLALSLIKAGYTVKVINEPSLSLSSQVAAGIWNPIVFKRLTKSWLADLLVPELLLFYEYWQQQFNTTFIHKRHIIKPFTEEQEKTLWLKKAHDKEAPNAFLDSELHQDLFIDEEFVVKSYSKVLQAGNLDIIPFLEETRRFLKESDSYFEDSFDYSQLVVTDEQVNYKGICADKLICCEGYLIANNPYFNWIPMKPAKGETLTIHCPLLKLTNDIFNKGFFIMPLGNNLFKIGATYQWQELNDQPTPAGKTELVNKLSAVLTAPYTIVEHNAGVRPSVIDRRPVMGHHPTSKNLFVFNGLGTKAVMLAPYFAKQLVNYFKEGTIIDEDVNCLRFVKNYN